LIPFVDLKIQHANIKTEIEAAVANVLASSQFVLGEEVAAFEEEFAVYCGARYGIAVNSGTSALHLALLAAGLGPGDEVITVPFTFVATVAAILYAGARPVFVDIDPQSYTIDTKQIENALTERTKAIIPVHLYGQPADMEPILDIARRHGLTVIDDAAQAHRSEYKGRRIGSIGDLSCFSFYPGKNLGAYGEGGIVLTNNPEYARSISMLRDWGQKEKYQHTLKGYNYRMDGLQGSILRVKLRHLDSWTETRRANAALYNQLLSQSEVITPCEMPYAHHVYHVYVVRTPHRQRLQQALFNQDIQTGIHYPIPVHLQPAYADLGYRAGDFPCSEQAAREVLSLPMYVGLGSAQLESVSETVSDYFNQTRNPIKAARAALRK
jgi:dTDP-4-amino-4,6-dideoxygalactose transaminase